MGAVRGHGQGRRWPPGPFVCRSAAGACENQLRATVEAPGATFAPGARIPRRGLTFDPVSLPSAREHVAAPCLACVVADAPARRVRVGACWRTFAICRIFAALCLCASVLFFAHYPASLHSPSFCCFLLSACSCLFFLFSSALFFLVL